MSSKTSELGAMAERLASRYLSERGYRILNRNYRKPWGEIDVVVEKDDCLMFVEIKASRQFHSGFDAELRAGMTKLHKVARTAQTYLADHHYSADQLWQIDIVSVTFARRMFGTMPYSLAIM